MKEQICQWTRNIAVFYLIFSSILHLIPDKKYERYVRSFMGLLLIYMICVPVFTVFGKSAELLKNFEEYFQKERKVMEQLETNELQAFYLEQAYEKELETEILRYLKKTGIYQAQAVVDIEGEQIFLNLTVSQKLTEKQEGGICDELRENFGIAEKNCQIFFEGDVRSAVDGASSSGTSSDSDLSSGIRQ